MKIHYFTIRPRFRLLLIFSVALFIFFTVNTSGNYATLLKKFRYSLAEEWMYRNLSQCNPERNIFYLKTHKCASSAIQNIIFRHGLNKDLTFALPDTSNYFGVGRHFNRKMISPSMHQDLKINIFAVHSQWNRQEHEAVMPNNTIYITSMREPSSLFESLFSYVDFFKKDSGLSIDKYVEMYPTDSKRAHGYIGYNQMSYDLGMNISQMMDDKAVKNKISEIDEVFDLVLIAEKMEESLVLLRHLLCWEWDDIVTLKINARQEKYKEKLSEETNIILRERQQADERLYSHYSRKLNRMIEAFGRDRMAGEVDHLRKLTEKMMERCNFTTEPSTHLKGNNKPWSEKVNGYQGNFEDESCRRIALSEHPMLEFSRMRQRLSAHRAKRKKN